MTAPLAPVLVTGVTGYIGSEVALQLLAAGYNVRGTTRDVEQARSAGHLMAMPGADERLELVEADLLKPRSLVDAIEGCEYVMHVASPYILDVDDPQRDLIDPAVNGTVSVLEDAEAAGVKRVILTSSFAAVAGAPRTRPFNEEDWNSVSTLDNGPYSYSKALAERAAWDFMDAKPRSFDLVSINPTGVIGPSVVPRVNQTGVLFSNLTNGEMPGIIDIEFAYVDIRDVGRAHVAAMENPGASGRYICSAASVSVRDIVDVMKGMGVGERYKLTSLSLDNAAGTVIVRLLANFQPRGTRAFLKSHLGTMYDIDTTRIQEGLGIEFMPVDDSIRDGVADAEKWGFLGRKVRVGETSAAS